MKMKRKMSFARGHQRAKLKRAAAGRMLSRRRFKLRAKTICQRFFLRRIAGESRRSWHRSRLYIRTSVWTKTVALIAGDTVADSRGASRPATDTPSLPRLTSLTQSEDEQAEPERIRCRAQNPRLAGQGELQVRDGSTAVALIYFTRGDTRDDTR